MLDLISTLLGGIRLAEKLAEYAPRFKRAWDERLAQRTSQTLGRDASERPPLAAGWARRYIENYEYVDEDVLRALYEEVWIRQVSGAEDFSQAALDILPKCNRTTLEDLVRLGDYAWQIEDDLCLVTGDFTHLLAETGITSLRMDNLEDRGIVRPRHHRTLRVERLRKARTGVISAEHQGRPAAIGVPLAGWDTEWELPLGEVHLTGVGKELIRLGRSATDSRGLAMAQRVWGERRLIAIGERGETVDQVWTRLWIQLGLERLERLLHGKNNILVRLLYRRIHGPQHPELQAAVSSTTGYRYTQSLGADPLLVTVPTTLAGELVDVLVIRPADAKGVKKTIRLGVEPIVHRLSVPTDAGYVTVEVSNRLYDGDRLLLGPP